MKFKRCDRCNSEIKQAKGLELGMSVICDALKEFAFSLSGKPKYELYRDEEKADLCPACKKSFDEWMKAGAESQHQNQQEEAEPNRNIETEQETEPSEQKTQTFIVAKAPDFGPF